VRLGIGEDRLLRREALVLVGPGDVRVADLGELVAQQVDLARTGTLVAAQ
jgi:hypothetical protein